MGLILRLEKHALGRTLLSVCLILVGTMSQGGPVGCASFVYGYVFVEGHLPELKAASRGKNDTHTSASHLTDCY